MHGIPLLGTMSPLSYFPTLLLSYRLNSYRKFILSIPEKHWQNIDEFTSVTSKEFILKTWEKPRRFVIRRVKIDKDTPQLLLDYKDFYRYEAVVTNMEGEPAEIM
ncbi:MAG: hypothetical protein AB1414_18285, partial [bacterium]